MQRHNKCQNEFILHGKFHAFFKKCTPFGLCHPTIMHVLIYAYKHLYVSIIFVVIVSL